MWSHSHRGSKCFRCAFVPSTWHPWCHMFLRLLSLRVCLPSLYLSLLPLLFHSLLVLCPAHHLPQCRHCWVLKPLHSRTMMSIDLWRYTILSQLISATYKQNAEANTRAFEFNQKTMLALDSLAEEYEIFEETMKKVTLEKWRGWHAVRSGFWSGGRARRGSERSKAVYKTSRSSRVRVGSPFP